MTMADLTPERLAELRRIAEAATPGPWIKDADKRYSVRSHWNPPRDGNVVGWRVCVVSGNGPQSDADWDYITEFNPKTALALLDRVEQLEADNNKLKRENGELYRRIERLEAKLARQRVVLRRLQAAVERRNSEERIEAMRRALHDETVERYMRAYDAAADEAEWWKRRHDALRAAVIKADALIVDAINRATAMYNQTQDADYDSRADGLDEALMILRQLLAEAGGGDT